MKRNIDRQVVDACRRTRHETERKMEAALVAADSAVKAASGLCELRRTDGPRLRLTRTVINSAERPRRNLMERYSA